MRSDCPLNFGLELFGDKWTLLIIRDLMFFHKSRYNEFLASAEGISTNILADRLTVLEREGFIRKIKDREHKNKFIYRLSEKGIDLLPVIVEIGFWSGKYGDDLLNAKMRSVLERIKKDGERGLALFKERLYQEHNGKEDE